MVNKVVILGAGYGGVRCALELAQKSSPAEIEIILVNKHNYHQFVTQLHETAAGLGDANEIRVPLPDILDLSRIKLIKDTVARIIPNDNKVRTEKDIIAYDFLVVGLGSEPEYFNIPGLKQYSLTLRSLNSARLIRSHIEKQFASYKASPEHNELLTVVVGGAGFTGVELTGELAEWLPKLAAKYDIPEKLISLVSIEAAPSIMTGYDQSLIESAYQVLQEKRVRIITGTTIEEVFPAKIKLSSGETIDFGTFVWTGGVRANKMIMASALATAARGRAKVNKYLQAENYTNIYVIGDNAFITNPETGKIMGPTAQVAIQSGFLAAHNILAQIRGQALKVFYPKELGRVVSLGQKVAVGKVGTKFKSKGRIASILKHAIDWKYLYSIGGLKMLAKKVLS